MNERKQTFSVEDGERFERIVMAMVEKYLNVTVTPLPEKPNDSSL